MNLQEQHQKTLVKADDTIQTLRDNFSFLITGKSKSGRKDKTTSETIFYKISKKPMRYLYSLLLIITVISISNTAQAKEVYKPIITSMIMTQNNTITANAPLLTKQVYLMNIKLTPQQKYKILSYNPTNKINATENLLMNISLPNKANLNMDKVPVLNQGKHGSCVTFANTAAIDAVLGHGDYISQLCTLALSSYFSENSIRPQSGWHGQALGPIILSQLISFGFINKDKQKHQSCGGLYEYPTNDPYHEGQPMFLEEFKAMREDSDIEWQSLLTLSQRLGTNPSDPTPYDGNKILSQAKQFLALSVSKSKENPIGLITFGSFLPVDYCNGGACARYHVVGDTWALTPDIDKIDPSHATLPGHEMIIMGYDDNAVAIDTNGNQHNGLLFLRSSWGDDVGDQGNYYMTYNFFKKFVIEVQLIYQPVAPD